MEKAEAIDKEHKDVVKLREKIEKIDGEADQKAKKQFKDKLNSARKKAASYYEKLALSFRNPDKDQQVRVDEYLFMALKLEPSDKRWENVYKLIYSLINGREADRGFKILNKCLEMKPPESLVKKLHELQKLAAIDRIILNAASSHPMKYYFSLPKNFKQEKDKKWPVLICVDGAGSNFKGMANGYFKNRGDLPFMIVSPCSFTNTNAIQGKMLEKYKEFYSDEDLQKVNDDGRFKFDEEGVLAIIKDLQKEYDAESKVYVTGFSGGGNITYMMIFKHPDLMNGAAPACANFMNSSYSSLKGQFKDEDLNFPIHIFTGEKDPHRKWTHGKEGSPGIEMQTDAAVNVLDTIGYPNYKRTMVPGMGHSSAQKQVLEALGPYMTGKKSRSDKLDAKDEKDKD